MIAVLVRRGLGLAAAAFALTLSAQAQDFCADANRNWKAYGETSFIGNVGSLDQHSGPAFRYLDRSSEAAQVTQSCPDGRGAFTNKQVSDVIRAAMQHPFFCAQLTEPMKRLDFLKKYAAEKRPKAGDPFTGLELSGYQLSSAEAAYWSSRLDDLASDPACATSVGIDDRRKELADLKSQLTFVEGRARAAGQACQASTETYRQAVVSVLQQKVDPGVLVQARAALKPKETAARNSCEPFGWQATGVIDSFGEEIDWQLGASVPACQTLIASVGQTFQTADKANQGRDAAFAAAARDALDAPIKSAPTACKDYPGILSRLKRAHADMVAIAGPPK